MNTVVIVEVGEPSKVKNKWLFTVSILQVVVGVVFFN